MKVNVVSPFTRARSSQIADYLSKSDALLTILPGISENHPRVEEVQDVIKDGKYVFMEVMDTTQTAKKMEMWPSIISNGDIRRMPKQLFAQNPRPGDIAELMDIWDDRTVEFTSGGKTVSLTFIICGEINGFNPDGKLKYGYSYKKTNIVNPCHTIMGHWNWLKPKLENISIGNTLIYVSNNDRNSSAITSSLRIYRNGHQTEMRRSAPGMTWAQTEI